MNTQSFQLIFLLAALLMASCEEEEIVSSPEELIQGKWIIQSLELLGQEQSGDGSYLLFEACQQVCKGEDYDASDSTSGNFTYTLNEEGTILSIDDTSSAGGNYDAEWDVLDLNENQLRIVGNTFLGSLKIEMTRD